MQTITGKVYYENKYGGSSNKYYFLATNDCKRCSFINQLNQTISILSGTFTNIDLRETREATYEETMWFEECFKQNKFIPLEEFIKSLNISYEIY